MEKELLGTQNIDPSVLKEAGFRPIVKVEKVSAVITRFRRNKDQTTEFAEVGTGKWIKAINKQDFANHNLRFDNVEEAIELFERLPNEETLEMSIDYKRVD